MRAGHPASSPPRLAVVLALLLGPGVARAEEAPQWIVVVAPAHRQAIEPLCSRREAQGYRVVRVSLPSPEKVGAPVSTRLRTILTSLVRGTTEPSTVLLVGATPGVESGALADAAAVVPALDGTVGRMEGRPTDLGFGLVDDDLLPDVAVGRFPARTAAEVSAMVAKTIAFEDAQEPQPWRDRITLLVGHPGGASALERRLAVGIVGGDLAKGLARVHPRWDLRAIVDMPGSPFDLPGDVLEAVGARMLGDGQLVTVYLGHSGPDGLFSDGVSFLGRSYWEGVGLGPRAGVLLSCGCYTCQLAGFGGDAFGLAAMRNPLGPVAVVGAQGESYGAFGKLAFEGLLPVLEAAEPSERLGAWWLAMQRGIADGPIGLLTFQVYDRADGSGGKVPLATQRAEHLEMWSLLGDPALRLPLVPADLQLRVDGAVRPGATLTIRGTLPERMRAGPAVVSLVLDRPFGALPPDAPDLPQEEGPARDAALRRRHVVANGRDILRQTVPVEAGRFEASVVLPEALPFERVTLRAQAVGGGATAHAALALPVGR
jgi:hypothetical protein